MGRNDGLDAVARLGADLLAVDSVRIVASDGDHVHVQGAFGPHPSDCAFRVDRDLRLSGRRVGVITLCDSRSRPLDTRTEQVLADVVRLAEGEVERLALKDLVDDLRDQESRLRVLLTTVPVGVMVVHADGRLEPVNPAAATLTGGPSAVRTLSEVFPSLSVSSPPFDLRRVDDPDEGGQPPITSTLSQPDGTRTVAEIAVATLPDSDDADATARWLLLVRDLSLTADAQLALERQRRLTQLVLDSAGDGLVGLDSDGRVIFANIGARRMLKCRESDLSGQRLHDLVEHSDATGSPIAWEDCPVRHLLTDGQPRTLPGQRYTRRDGSTMPVDVVATPIVEGGHVTGAVTSFRDVTDVIAMEELKRQFIGVVSHELRTPLTSIKASLRLLDSGIMGSVSEEQQELLTMAVNNSDRLGRLVDDILDLERLDAGAMPLRPESVDPVALARLATDGVAATAAAAGVSVDLQPAREPIRVHVDPNRMIQVLTNLLGNAIKFSDAGSRVTVAVAAEGAQCRIAVSDEGRGIPADQLDAIFDRFRQVEVGDARRTRGTGLGLPIARELVTRSGGSIEVSSTPGRGSTFTVVLPAEPQDTEPPDTEPSDTEPPDTEPRDRVGSSDGAQP